MHLPSFLGPFPKKSCTFLCWKSSCDLQWYFVGVVTLGRERCGAVLRSPGGTEQGSQFGMSTTGLFSPSASPRTSPSITLEGKRNLRELPLFFGAEGINFNSALSLTKPVIMPQLCLLVLVIYYLFAGAADGITAAPPFPSCSGARPWRAGAA